jgi:hypothetical protein
MTAEILVTHGLDLPERRKSEQHACDRDVDLQAQLSLGPLPVQLKAKVVQRHLSRLLFRDGERKDASLPGTFSNTSWVRSGASSCHRLYEPAMQTAAALLHMEDP